jgi:hypothetical protein
MKKVAFKILALVVLFVVPTIVHAQLVRIKVNRSSSFCGFNIKKGYYYQGQPQQYITREAQVGDNSGIADVVKEIQTTLGFSTPIRVYIAKDEDNCFASIGEKGIRLIVADQLFLSNVNKVSGTQWAAISILAHEIGHHIAGFTRRSSSLDSELDADYWSGYVLQKLGSSKDAAVKCIMHFGTEQNTSSHPNKYLRSNTIRLGWEDGVKGAYDNDRCESCN